MNKALITDLATRSAKTLPRTVSKGLDQPRFNQVPRSHVGFSVSDFVIKTNTEVTSTFDRSFGQRTGLDR